MAEVTGTPNNDTIGVGTASVGVQPPTGATSENDTINGLSGADTMAGGPGSDDFQFDPSNPLEGTDVIQDFAFQATTTGPSQPPQATPGATPPPQATPMTGPSQLDYVALASAQVLAADPDLPGADGDETSLSLDDFEASPNWNLSSSVAGSLLVEHPGGSIEFVGVPSNAVTSFNDLAPFIKVDGQIWSGPIDLAPQLSEDTGTDVTDIEDEGIGDTESDGPIIEQPIADISDDVPDMTDGATDMLIV
jgi:hypothetical protein